MIRTENGRKIFTIEMDELDDDFVAHLEYLYNTYSENLLRMNGFHNKNLNFSSFIDAFIDAAVPAAASIDGNANSSAHDVCTLTNDMTKPHTKLLGFNKIFYDFKKKYGLFDAQAWLTGEWLGAFYLHDAPSATIKPYCFAYDLDQLVEKGLFFVNKFPTGPAQHLTTFNNHVLEFISWNCNRTSGAVGLPSYIVYNWYFWHKDVADNFYLRDPEYYRRQCFQQFIFDLNQPYLRISESAFTNISIMDRNYLTELFGGRMFPDGTFAIDHIDEILEHQKIFMEVVSEVRKTNMMTFPVLTYCLLFQNGRFVDEEFARWCSDHNCEWFDSNFYNGDNVATLSNCCFDGRQEVTIRTNGHIYNAPFKRMYQTFHDREVEVYFNGEWQPARLTALNEKHPTFQVVTEQGRSMIATEDHIHLTTEGEKKTWELKPGMVLQIETHPMDKINTNSTGVDTITQVDRVDQEDDWVFCVEVQNKDNPYFCLSNGIQTHNCRLLSDTSKLDAFINSIGGTSLSVGSVKVNDINLRRIALEAQGDEDRYMEILKQRIDICVKTLDVVRHIIFRNVEKGLLPNYRYKLIDMEKQYNTIGITAMYEVMQDFGYIETDEFGNKFYSDKAMAFAKRIMKQLNEQKESYGFPYSLNIENSPSERSNVVLAKKDRELYPEARTYRLYSNQWIALTEKCTIQEKVRLGSILDKECGGGQISHINVEGRFTSTAQAWKMLNYIASQGVIYFAFNTKISVCENNHSFFGEVCPVCGKPKKTQYTRVVGFYTDVSVWIPERQEEFKERQWFDPREWLTIGSDM